jgi:hypothetical protein
MFSPLQRLAALPNIIAVIIRLAFYSFFSLIRLACRYSDGFASYGATRLMARVVLLFLFRRVSLRTRFCLYSIFFFLNFLIYKGFTRLIFKLVYKLNICPLIQSDLAHNLELTPLMIVNT